MGKTVQLELTPMIGGVVGQTDGIIPAVELDLPEDVVDDIRLELNIRARRI